MAFKMKNPSIAKMAKMAGDSRSAAKFNAGLREASAEGKLDNNPKFKEAVDSAPMKLKEGKGTKKLDVSDFASPSEVKGKTGGNAKELDMSKIKSPAKLRKPEPKRKKDQPKEKAVDVARKKVGDTARPKGSAVKLDKKFYGDRTRKEMRKDQREHRESLGGDKDAIKANRKYHRGRKKELRAEELERRGKTKKAERKMKRGKKITDQFK